MSVRDSKYELKFTGKNKDREPVECESCGYAAPVRTFQHHEPGGDFAKMVDVELCALCASTSAGNALEYPGQYPELNALRTICFVGNAILEALNKRGN
jgi:hypothetical protein